MTLFKVRIQKASPSCDIQTQSVGVTGILCFSCRKFMISNLEASLSPYRVWYTFDTNVKIWSRSSCFW